jgi:hypothetical protein
MWGYDAVSDGMGRTFTDKALSPVLDNVPGVGVAKGIKETVSGVDPVSGQKVNQFIAAGGVLLAMVDLKGIYGSTARFTSDEALIFRNLDKYHGIDSILASDRLHLIKDQNGLGAADNVIFDMTGNVYHPVTGENLGTLTMGGARR